MRAWRAAIDTIDGLTNRVLEEGLFALEFVRDVMVTAETRSVYTTAFSVAQRASCDRRRTSTLSRS